MEIISLKEYLWFSDFVPLSLLVKEEALLPSFGDIWICRMPVLVKSSNKYLYETVFRPILIVDDRHEHLIRKDSRNYYGLKITSQSDSYQRIRLSNYLSLGLKKVSYLRIEMPLKIEYNQFVYKIGEMDIKDVTKYLKMVKKSIIF